MTKVVLAIISFFLGGLGIDRFIEGKIGTGILKLITLGGFGIWWLIDFIFILMKGHSAMEAGPNGTFK